MSAHKNQLSRSHFATRSSISWFLDVGYHYGTMTESRAREIAGVNRTTFDRWIRGESSAPAATLELLRLHAFGEPPGQSGKWQGFRFTNGVLVVDDSYEYTPEDVRSLWNWRRLAMQYLNEMKSGNISPALNFNPNEKEFRHA